MVWDDKMRHLKCFVILSVILALLASPIAVLASDISGAKYWAKIVVTNNSTANSSVATTCSISTQNLIDGDYLNATANNCVMRSSSGADIPFMPSANASYPWCLWVDSIGDYGVLTDILYTANSTGGDINYFPGAGGMTTTDSASLELSDNFTIEQSGWVDTDAGSGKNLVYKQGAFRTSVSPTVSGNITSGIFEWVTPTADGGVWTNPGNAYDNNTVSKATLNIPGGPVWSNPLTLTIPATMADAVEFYCSRSNPSVTQIRVEVFYGGGWNNIFEGAWTADIWEVKEIPAGTQSVTQIRISEYNSTGGIAQGDINEVRVDTYLNTSVTATGVTSGEHTVKTQMVDNTGAGWLAGWDNRMRFDVDADQVDSNLTWFPTLVKLSSSSGIGNDDVTAVFDELGANHLKLAITESDGTTEMYVEVEKWDEVAEEAWLWTSSNTTAIASGTDTTFYLYYDNDHADNVAHVGVPNDAVVENVWGGNFVLVDHMQDDPDTSHTRDSTSNNNDGTKKGANEPLEAIGKIGDAQDFDGIDDYIACGDINELDSANEITLEAIVTLDDFDTSFPRILNKASATATGSRTIDWNVYDNGQISFVAGGSELLSDAGEVVTGTRYYLAVTAKMDIGAGADEKYIYKNGIEIKSNTSLTLTPVDSGAREVYIGSFDPTLTDTREWDGLIDEIRVSNIVRSLAWSKATHYTCWDNFIDFIPNADGELEDFLLDFKIYVDGTLEDHTLGVAVPNTSANWTFVENYSMLYLHDQEITIDGVSQQEIEWEYDDTTFTDLSGQSHDAYPTFRTATADPDITAEMTSFAPMSEAKAGDYTLALAPPFIDADALTGNVTGAFTTVPPDEGFPLAGVITAIANATSTPPQLPLLIIAVFIIIAFSLSISYVMRIHGSGTIFVKILVISAIMGIFIALKNFGIDFWMLIVFLIISSALAMASRQLGFT